MGAWLAWGLVLGFWFICRMNCSISTKSEKLLIYYYQTETKPNTSNKLDRSPYELNRPDAPCRIREVRHPCQNYLLLAWVQHYLDLLLIVERLLYSNRWVLVLFQTK